MSKLPAILSTFWKWGTFLANSHGLANKYAPKHLHDSELTTEFGWRRKFEDSGARSWTVSNLTFHYKDDHANNAQESCLELGFHLLYYRPTSPDVHPFLTLSLLLNLKSCLSPIVCHLLMSQSFSCCNINHPCASKHAHLISNCKMAFYSPI